jgi:hypothetical protein
VGATVDGDGGDVDRGLLAHTQSLVVACSSSSPALARTTANRDTKAPPPK